MDETLPAQQIRVNLDRLERQQVIRIWQLEDEVARLAAENAQLQTALARLAPSATITADSDGEEGQ